MAPPQALLLLLILMLALHRLRLVHTFCCHQRVGRNVIMASRKRTYSNILNNNEQGSSCQEAEATTKRNNNSIKYFLLKSEPDEYSITNLKNDKTEEWDGIRNYQARNFLRAMQVGDRAFFYHSKTKLAGIVGTCRIARVAQPDASACDPKSDYYDPKCTTTPDSNKWSSVLIEYEQTFPVVLTLKEIKNAAENYPEGLIAKLPLLKQSRLSVVPLTREQWNELMKMIETKKEAEMM